MIASPLVRLALAAAVAAASFAAGWQVSGWRLGKELAQTEQRHARESAAAEKAARERLQAAAERGDALVTQLAESEAARQKALQEKSHALKSVTKDQPCLGAAALRLLNAAAQPDGIRLSLPEAAGQSADAFAAAPADHAYATDTTVALWAADARERYDACRARIDALREFHAGQ